MDNQSTLRIIGPSKLVILRTLPLLYRFKPFHWRVQDPYGRKNYISYLLMVLGGLNYSLLHP